MAKMNRAEKRKQKKLSAKAGRQGAMTPLPPPMQNALNVAAQKLQQGAPQETLAIVERLLQDVPSHPLPLCLKGLALHHVGEAEKAVAVLTTVTKRAPAYADAHVYLGNALRDLGQIPKALSAYKRALSHNPEAHDARFNLANALFESQDFEQAAEQFEKIPSSHPHYAQALEFRGNALKRLERFDEACTCFEELVRLTPTAADAHLKLGASYKECGDLERARACYLKTLEIEPKHAGAHFNLGNYHSTRLELEDAAHHYKAAIELRPDELEWHCNLGSTYQDMGRLDDAMDAFNAALARDPNYDKARNNLGLLQLMRGDFANGWANYDARSNASDSKRIFTTPLWQGEALDGKRLAVTCEQGVGDQILYATILRDFAGTDTDVIMECDQRLVPLFERSALGDNISFVGQQTPPAKALNAEGVDAHIPLGSLGRYLRTGHASFKARDAFLHADPDYAETLRNRYRDWSGGKPVVGISWYSGNEQLKNRKSMDLALWQPILSNPNFAYLSLQYGDVEGQLKTYKDETGIDILFDPEIDALKDMDGFTAQVEAVDFVITISNATAHVAGAIGKETWLMLSYIPVWCWQLEGNETLWYDSIHVYRQRQAGEWAPVISDVKTALEKRGA